MRKADVVMLQSMATIEHGGDATVLLSMSRALLLREYNTCVGKITRNYIQLFLTLVLFTFCTVGVVF